MVPGMEHLPPLRARAVGVGGSPHPSPCPLEHRSVHRPPPGACSALQFGGCADPHSVLSPSLRPLLRPGAANSFLPQTKGLCKPPPITPRSGCERSGGAAPCPRPASRPGEAGAGAGRGRCGCRCGMGWALLAVGLLLCVYTLLRHGLRRVPPPRAPPALRGRTAIVTGERRAPRGTAPVPVPVAVAAPVRPGPALTAALRSAPQGEAAASARPRRWSWPAGGPAWCWRRGAPCAGRRPPAASAR